MCTDTTDVYPLPAAIALLMGHSLEPWLLGNAYMQKAQSVSVEVSVYMQEDDGHMSALPASPERLSFGTDSSAAEDAELQMQLRLCCVQRSAPPQPSAQPLTPFYSPLLTSPTSTQPYPTHSNPHNPHTSPSPSAQASSACA